MGLKLSVVFCGSTSGYTTEGNVSSPSESVNTNSLSVRYVSNSELWLTERASLVQAQPLFCSMYFSYQDVKDGWGRACRYSFCPFRRCRGTHWLILSEPWWSSHLFAPGPFKSSLPELGWKLPSVQLCTSELLLVECTLSVTLRSCFAAYIIFQKICYSKRKFKCYILDFGIIRILFLHPSAWGQT